MTLWLRRTPQAGEISLTEHVVTVSSADEHPEPNVEHVQDVAPRQQMPFPRQDETTVSPDARPLYAPQMQEPSVRFLHEIERQEQDEDELGSWQQMQSCASARQPVDVTASGVFVHACAQALFAQEPKLDVDENNREQS